MKIGTKRAIVLAVGLTVIILVSYSLASLSVAIRPTPAVTTGQSAQWLVTSSSNVTTMWYSETFSPRGNFSAPVGSTINLTITSTAANRFRGDISIGQLALENVSMMEISFNLLLGWYPFEPGLVCPTNWDVQKQNATDNGLTVAESRMGDLHTIVFTHLSGGNGTILIYDEVTGMLVSGYGAFGQFMIQVTLISTGIDLGSVRANYSLLVLISLTIVLLTTVLAISAVLILRERATEKRGSRERRSASY